MIVDFLRLMNPGRALGNPVAGSGKHSLVVDSGLFKRATISFNDDISEDRKILARHLQAAASGSPFIDAVRNAFDDEVYDASQCLLEWTSCTDQCAIEVNEEVVEKSKEDAGCRVSIALRRRKTQTRDEKIAEIQRCVSIWCARANDINIWGKLAECFGLGLSRILGESGDYATAKTEVDRTFAVRPYSYYLKAASFALQQRLDGKDVYDYLIKFIGRDNGALKNRLCVFPFKRMDIGPDGNCLVCCGHWLPRQIGNIEQQNGLAIANSETAKRIRASMLDGTYKYCNHLECPMIQKNILPRFEEIKDAGLKKIIATNNLEVTGIEQMIFAYDRSCNLSCPSCRRERIVERTSTVDHKVVAVEKNVVPLLSELKILNLNPAGEFLFSRSSRKLLENINEKEHPDLAIDLISNGVLFNRAEWEKLSNIHNKIRSVRISVDGCTKDTFESLRRLAVFEKFVENMEFLASLRRENKIPKLRFSFTYQLGNFREMADFVRFGRSFNTDNVIFERLQNLGAFSHNEYIERAVHRDSHPLHMKFRKIISDSIFSDKDVWHDFNWEPIQHSPREEYLNDIAGII